jgi:hypothetical protein
MAPIAQTYAIRLVNTVRTGRGVLKGISKKMNTYPVYQLPAVISLSAMNVIELGFYKTAIQTERHEK